MTFDYSRSRATAERLIARFGQSGSIRRLTPGGGPDYDPGEPTTTDYDVTFVLSEYSNREIDGTLIKAGDKKVLLSTEGLSITPALGDRIVVAGTAHRIENIKPLNPGGTVLLYEMQARI